MKYRYTFPGGNSLFQVLQQVSSKINFYSNSTNRHSSIYSFKFSSWKRFNAAPALPRTLYPHTRLCLTLQIALAVAIAILERPGPDLIYQRVLPPIALVAVVVLAAIPIAAPTATTTAIIDIILRGRVGHVLGGRDSRGRGDRASAGQEQQGKQEERKFTRHQGRHRLCLCVLSRTPQPSWLGSLSLAAGTHSAAITETARPCLFSFVSHREKKSSLWTR